MSDYKVDRRRWAQMGIIEQMGNIGSEVGRAIKARREGAEERVEPAIIRALDLFDATVEALIARRQPHRAKEVLRARTEFMRLFYDDAFEAEADGIERYFMQFAIAARNPNRTPEATGI
jgi:hypothetical protein